MVVNRIGDIAPGALVGQYWDFGQWNELEKMVFTLKNEEKYSFL